jgi:glycosyltransferase involved in cell wall biosynthesis
MQNSSIAVVIPFYNASSTIMRALEGVFNQTLLPQEVLLVDDGSTDDGLAVISGSKYKDLVTLISIDNSGPANARNVGIKAATAEWIAFLDSDDQWISKDKLKSQLALAETDDNIVLVDTFAKIHWKKHKTRDITKVKQGSVFEQFLYQNAVNATSSVITKRRSIIQAGYFDPNIKFGEDRLLWALIAKQGYLATLREFAVYKENHEENLTSKGEDNYQYREMVVSKLLPLSSLTDKTKKRVLLAKFEDFLMLGRSNRDGKLYRKFAHMAYAETGATFVFSKFSILYVASFFFGLFSKK